MKNKDINKIWDEFDSMSAYRKSKLYLDADGILALLSLSGFKVDDFIKEVKRVKEERLK